MASTNNLERSQKYLNLILELFKRGSLTARLDNESMQYDHSDANVVKVLTVTTNGLGNYQKDVGYPLGAIKTEWIPLELKVDRGVRFLLDRIDDDEVLGLSIGTAAQNFTDMHMIPELDAYRLNCYYSGAGKVETQEFLGSGGTDNILKAIDHAATYMNGLDVPETGRILYINQNLEFIFRGLVSRTWSNDAVLNTRIETYNGLQIVYVPNKRFQTLIELNSGESDQWGYKIDTDSQDINFMLLYPKSVVQASKTARGKFISADENQRVDSNEFQFRIYHDAFVVDKLKDGVFVNVKPAEVTP